MIRNSSASKLHLLVTAVLGTGTLVVLSGIARIGTEIPSWWQIALVAVACGLGDLALLHLRFGHDQHSFTWSEVALVVGLVALPTPWLRLVAPVGVAVAHFGARRSPLKVVFNAMSFSIGVWLARATIHAMGVEATTEHIAKPSVVLALALGSLVFFVWNTLTVSAAVAYSQDSTVLSVLRRGFGLNTLVWACNTLAGIIIVALVVHEPLVVAVLPVGIAALYLVYRAYLHAIEQRDIWHVLQATSRELQQVRETDVAQVVCARLPELLRAEFVELLLVDHETARAYRSPSAEQINGTVEELAGSFWPRVKCERAPFEVEAASAPPRQADDLRALGLTMCVITPLLAQDGCIGSLRIGFRGPVRLRTEEIQVLDTFANHVASAVRNAWLFEQTRAERSELDRILNQSTDGIAAVDATWVVRRWNPAMSEITGLEAGDAIGRPLFDGLEVFDRIGRRTTSARLAELLDVSTPEPLTLELVTPSGRRWVQLSAGYGSDANLAVLVAHDITERRQFEQQLTHQALHDPLTGLPNRTLVLDRLGHALALAGRDDRRVAVLFCDLDRFKVINDSLGHDVGDQLLVAAAQRITAALRHGDTAARFGGDEFVVLCEQVESDDDIDIVTRRLMRALSAPFIVDGREAFVTVSIGVAISNDRTVEPAELLRDADAAMYLAKERGRNRAEFFNVDMRQRALARLETENDLRRGIERGELRLHYQPYVDLTHPTHVMGAEALVRWQHPERGLVQPGDFIDLAEETGLVRPIGQWVLHETCRQLSAMKGDPDAPRYISINVSAHQLTDDRFVHAVAGALAEWEIEPHRLCLEITETALIGDTDAALSVLNQLKLLGVRLALDDFGTGYSALSYLRMLPVDTVKLDRSFVSRLTDSPRDRAIVAGIIDLAHALGLTVVAEGVEQDAEALHLRRLGCDLGQGFLFARPDAALPGATSVAGGRLDDEWADADRVRDALHA